MDGWWWQLSYHCNEVCCETNGRCSSFSIYRLKTRFWGIIVNNSNIMNDVSKTVILKIFAAMEKLLLWQQMLTCPSLIKYCHKISLN